MSEHNTTIMSLDEARRTESQTDWDHLKAAPDHEGEPEIDADWTDAALIDGGNIVASKIITQDDGESSIADLERRAIGILDGDAPSDWLIEWNEYAGGTVMRFDLADMDGGGLFIATGFCAAIDLTPEAIAAALRMSIYLGRGVFTIEGGQTAEV
ncbi:hypothetical protein [Sediminimonas sp.]|uniref:hypothetical protein n=1 Tax=Sediminimonas sp. TaxID=2823379 RepID=UPI0025E74BD1|nr:hypothetical protein [Sediminimonas sp.]